MTRDGETGADEILEVDLLAFEQGDAAARRAVVDGTIRSLQTGFVYTRHDLPESLIDEAYGLLAAFFALGQADKERFVAPGSHGQTGYTGLLVETAAGAEHADWKEMLAWGPTVAEAHPLRRRHPLNYRDQVLPEAVVPGITAVLTVFRDSILDLQRRFLRIIAVGLGAHEQLFDDLLRDGPHLTRAMRYPAMRDAPGPTSGPASTPTSACSPRCHGRPPPVSRCAPPTGGSTPPPPRAPSS